VWGFSGSQQITIAGDISKECSMSPNRLVQLEGGSKVPAASRFNERAALDKLAALCERQTGLEPYPLASETVSNVLIYDCEAVREAIADPDARRAVCAEWVEALMRGPGVVVLRRTFTDLGAIDAASAIFRAIIADQLAGHEAAGDHFAKPGANDRIWNALEKLCLRSPETFAAYYGNTILALISEAWLGPGYQMTSQVNVVNPGGAAQSPHSDYHVGFMTPAQMEQYPAHVHQLSPVLTLQGAVAHTAMPVESGPTLYLPCSQLSEYGYLAVTRPAVRDYFAEHHVQVPLAKGDAVFFNPALFHAAGANRTTDAYRMGNLLQISSAFGRAMETVDRTRMSVALYPSLLLMTASGRLSPQGVAAAVAACADGYPFPTNLDRDPPIGGLAPLSGEALMLAALRERRPADVFRADVLAQHARRQN
jgi:ectoine hydroxylase-related dioxygenase (phytanoyl-CoA dioxygenase family)